MSRTLENAEADRTPSDVSEEHEDQDEEVPLISGRKLVSCRNNTDQHFSGDFKRERDLW